MLSMTLKQGTSNLLKEDTSDETALPPLSLDCSWTPSPPAARRSPRCSFSWTDGPHLETAKSVSSISLEQKTNKQLVLRIQQLNAFAEYVKAESTCTE